MTDHPTESNRDGQEGAASTGNDFSLSERPTVLPPREEPGSEERSASPSRRTPTVFARRREFVAIVALVVLADLLLYRSAGYAGFALLLIASLPLLYFARPEDAKPERGLAISVLTVLVAFAAVRAVWLGHGGVVVVGCLLVTAWCRAVCGSRPFVIDTVLHTVLSWIYGLVALPTFRYLFASQPMRSSGEHGQEFSDKNQDRREPRGVVLPIIVTVAFGTLFILANPDSATWVREMLAKFSTRLTTWLTVLTPDAGEVVFWGFAAVTVLGLVRPVFKDSLLDALDDQETRDSEKQVPVVQAAMFASFRNSLVAVTILFAAYLVFEFTTFWRNDFPDGFYYAGYAHAGAAWLTVALAAASLLLSCIFRGTTLGDPRLPTLKTLAWIWSAENFLLAIAVINRLLIYVSFNGMTRMRVIGFLGVAAVVGGFVLVVVKILKRRGFIWLLRGDLVVLAFATMAYVLLPVDRMVHAYNARQILLGHWAPSVQITEHARGVGGDISLIPLLKCHDPVIRDGVAAFLANRAINQEMRIENPSASYDARTRFGKSNRKTLQWTRYQYAEREFLRRYNAATAGERRPSELEQKASVELFRKYAYQWY